MLLLFFFSVYILGQLIHLPIVLSVFSVNLFASFGLLYVTFGNVFRTCVWSELTFIII